MECTKHTERQAKLLFFFYFLCCSKSTVKKKKVSAHGALGNPYWLQEMSVMKQVVMNLSQRRFGTEPSRNKMKFTHQGTASRQKKSGKIFVQIFQRCRTKVL